MLLVIQVFWGVMPCEIGKQLPTFQRSRLPPKYGQAVHSSSNVNLKDGGSMPLQNQ